MIGRLRGAVVTESPDGMVVVDVQGVGYEVCVPPGTLGRCSRGADGAVTLQVHTQVREDAITLFGFASEHERATFRQLTTVAGVGPRTAVAILGMLPAHELAAAVARSDVKRLQAVPGVGKKIAERLVLELKDKLAPGTGPVAGNGATMAVDAIPFPLTAAAPRSPLVTTLLQLGFKPLEAERAAAELAPRAGEPLDALVREALKRLVR